MIERGVPQSRISAALRHGAGSVEQGAGSMGMEHCARSWFELAKIYFDVLAKNIPKG